MFDYLLSVGHSAVEGVSPSSQLTLEITALRQSLNKYTGSGVLYSLGGVFTHDQLYLVMICCIYS